MIIFYKIIFILIMLCLWLYTQRQLGKRQPLSNDGIQDELLERTQFLHQKVAKNPKLARLLLITSSLIVDALALWMFANAIFGNSIRPLLCLLLVFALRQLNQALTLLPSPKGMIWRDPGFPSLFVTYGVSNDLFFSGHTALAVLGALEIIQLGGPAWLVLGLAIAAFEIGTVLILRAHWTMDIFAGAITALWAHQLMTHWAPLVDIYLNTSL